MLRILRDSHYDKHHVLQATETYVSIGIGKKQIDIPQDMFELILEDRITGVPEKVVRAVKALTTEQIERYHRIKHVAA